MFKKIRIYIIFIFLIININPLYALEKNPVNIIEEEVKILYNIIIPHDLLLKNIYSWPNQDLIKKYKIAEDQYAEDFFEFIGVFILDYNSNDNLKIKLKFTRKAELDKAKIYWKVYF
jgi:hypothetical protein